MSTPPLRILTVCTANVCRSPVVEGLLARHLAEVGVDVGVGVTVTSAGTHGGTHQVHRDTLRAADAVGLDLRGHRSRRVDAGLLDHEGADLVIAMTREHLRHVVGIEPTVWPRAFTLRELVRRGTQIGPVAGFGTFADWRAAAAEGRRASELMRPDPADDLDDPYGGPAAGHVLMVDEVDHLTATLARLLAPIG